MTNGAILDFLIDYPSFFVQTDDTRPQGYKK